MLQYRFFKYKSHESMQIEISFFFCSNIISNSRNITCNFSLIFPRKIALKLNCLYSIAIVYRVTLRSQILHQPQRQFKFPVPVIGGVAIHYSISSFRDSMGRALDLAKQIRPKHSPQRLSLATMLIDRLSDFILG